MRGNLHSERSIVAAEPMHHAKVLEEVSLKKLSTSSMLAARCCRTFSFNPRCAAVSLGRSTFRPDTTPRQSRPSEREVGR